MIQVLYVNQTTGGYQCRLLDESNDITITRPTLQELKAVAQQLMTDIVQPGRKLAGFSEQIDKLARLIEEAEPHAGFRIDCGNGYIAVPRDAVTVNGLYLLSLCKAPPSYSGPFALLMPNGRAAMGEDGRRPYIYRTLDECRQDAEKLHRLIDEAESQAECRVDGGNGYFAVPRDSVTGRYLS